MSPYKNQKQLVIKTMMWNIMAIALRFIFIKLLKDWTLKNKTPHPHPKKKKKNWVGPIAPQKNASSLSLVT